MYFMSQLDNSNVSKHLGKTSSYKAIYDRTLLVREPRQSNRKHLGIADDALPFVGVDIWNAYEVSGILANGCPFAAIAKIQYPCDSKYIVESKSIKLYLNSFNMTRLGVSIEEALHELKHLIETDLSDLLETTVVASIKLAIPNTTPAVQIQGVKFIDQPSNIADLISVTDEFKTLERIVDISALKCDVYTETPGLLKSYQSESQVVQQYHSALLKSNCRVTSQIGRAHV